MLLIVLLFLSGCFHIDNVYKIEDSSNAKLEIKNQPQQNKNNSSPFVNINKNNYSKNRSKNYTKSTNNTTNNVSGDQTKKDIDVNANLSLK